MDFVFIFRKPMKAWRAMSLSAIPVPGTGTGTELYPIPVLGAWTLVKCVAALAEEWLEASKHFRVQNVWPVFCELLRRNPHLFERGERSENRPTYPRAILPLGRRRYPQLAVWPLQVKKVVVKKKTYSQVAGLENHLPPTNLYNLQLSVSH
jgi:hypothetical protein